MPTIHLITGIGKSACGRRKGAGMDEVDFRKEMKQKMSILHLCEKCKATLIKPTKIKNNT